MSAEAEEIALKVEGFVRDTVIPYERDPRIAARDHGPPDDLVQEMRAKAKAAGVLTCAWVGRDTCAEAGLFFSNRRAFKAGEPDYGRLLSAIMLQP